MSVKPPCERLLMPKYHLADRSTQRKSKSMKWHPEEGRPWKAPQSSIDWQDKQRKWLIVFETSSIEVIHIISKSPIVYLTCNVNVKQYWRTKCFWKRRDDQSRMSNKVEKIAIYNNVKPIREGCTTSQITIKGYIWSRKSRATTATLQALYQVLPRNNRIQTHFL